MKQHLIAVVRNPSAFVRTFFLLSFGLITAQAQLTNVVFSDDFAGGSIDTAKWAVDAPVFEGGKGNIAPAQRDGILEFSGTVTEQWWAGATLRALQTFPVSAETNVIVTVDRVQEAGVGTGSRSALWIMDSTQTRYILFADVRNEGGWHYNRKTGLPGDVPTGGGTDIAAFNGGTFDDGEFHQMQAVANGKTVRLYVDGKAGPNVNFPFDSLIFHLGSYARATDDTAFTIFDNFKVETVGAAAFSASTTTLLSGQTTSNITVRIPRGLNATQNIAVRVVSSDTNVAIPVGAVGDTLTMTFPAGGTNELALNLKSLGVAGSSRLTMSNDVGMATANVLDVVVILGPGTRLTEDFSAPIDTAKWTNSDVGFETGVGVFSSSVEGGQLVLSGTLDQLNYWGGISLNTVQSFTATPDLPLIFEMDRVSMDPTSSDAFNPSTGARSGVLMRNEDRSSYIFFGQNLGVDNTGWHVNVSAIGAGTALAPFATLTDTNNHKLKIVADGTSAEVFLDGVSGGSFAFPVPSGVFFDVAAYARDVGDAVKAVFDNVKIENAFPSIVVSPSAVSTINGVNASLVKVTIPRLLNVSTPVAVTVTSENPSVAFPEGAVGGKATLQFAAGGTNALFFKVITAGPGATVFNIATDQPVSVANNVNVSVTPEPVVVFSDTFSGQVLDDSKWSVDTTPLIEGGTTTFDSSVVITNGTLGMFVHAEVADWPGFSVYTKTSFNASAASPAVFEVDRVKMEYQLVGGDISKQRTGLWIRDSGTNYVFFSELGSWNVIPRGWQYHRVIGQTNDNLITATDAGSGTYMTSLDSPTFLDLGNHKLRAEVNGTSAKLYLDGVLGAEVAFPFSSGIRFGVGSFANFASGFGNITRGFFDNATVLGYPAAPPPLSKLTVVRQTNGDVVITWAGQGSLQSTATLGGNWTNVTPAPTGTSYTISAGSLGAQQFYRLAQ